MSEIKKICFTSNCGVCVECVEHAQYLEAREVYEHLDNCICVECI